MDDLKIMPCPKCNHAMRFRLHYCYNEQLYEVECSVCGLRSGAMRREEIIRKWMYQGTRTYRDVFLDKFPCARLERYANHANICRNSVFGLLECNEYVNCYKCWDEPYEEKEQ